MSEDKEISAMSTIAKALDSIADQPDARERILRWACARYSVALSDAPRKEKVADDKHGAKTDEGGRTTSFDTFADLYHTADPTTDTDRALVAGYWFGQGETRAEFTGFDANKGLKNLGHPLGHIADSLQSLIDRRPAFVMQTAKAGTSKQARKKYKLTEAGVAAVIAMTKPKE